MLYLEFISYKFLKSLYSVFSPENLYLRLFILFLSFALSLALLAPAVSAATVTLAWNSNTEPDLEGYIIYRNEGSSGPPYKYSITLPEDELVDPLNPEVTLTALKDDSKYYVAVTAYDISGNEGDFSNEVCVQISEGSAAICSESVNPDSGNNSGSGGGGGSGGCFISSIMHDAAQDSKVIDLKSPGYRNVVARFLLFSLLICTLSVARRFKFLKQRCSSFEGLKNV